MAYWEILLVAVALSMDAFAASICKGISVGRFNFKNSLTAGVYFGGFQALMPLLGFLLGSSFSGYIKAVDHWIAFALLLFLGIQMLRAAREKDSESCGSFSPREMLMMAVATSIDALAVGVTFAFLSVSIAPAVTSIGLITFAFSFAGVAIGNLLGSKFKKRAQIFGGLVLIGIGAKILAEHLIEK